MKKMLAAAVAAVMTMSASMAMADGAIKIGEIGPLTGAAAIYGTAVANGAQIAIDELNARGGQQYELNAQDDEADAEKSVNAYNNLLDWGAQMMLATVTTNPCIAVGAQAYEDVRFFRGRHRRQGQCVSGLLHRSGAGHRFRSVYLRA